MEMSDISVRRLSLRELVNLAAQLHGALDSGRGTSKEVAELGKVCRELASPRIQCELLIGPYLDKAQERSEYLYRAAQAAIFLDDYAKSSFKPEDPIRNERVFEIESGDSWIIVGGGITKEGRAYKCEASVLWSDYPFGHTDGVVDEELFARWSNDEIKRFETAAHIFLKQKKKVFAIV
jgi:hypothetical protein